MDASGNIIAPTYSVQGGTQSTVEDALMALDGAVITAGRRAGKMEDQLSSIFQDSPSARADGMNQIALSGVSGMVLTNLADGRVAPGSRDAVNGSQLYAAEQKISQNRNDLEAMRMEREMGQQAMRGLDSSVIDYGGARLTGVSDGSVSADSHDVVTGRQLFGVSDRVSKIEHQGRFLKIDTDQLSEDAFAGFLGVAIGDSARTQGEGDGCRFVCLFAGRKFCRYRPWIFRVSELLEWLRGGGWCTCRIDERSFNWCKFKSPRGRRGIIGAGRGV